MKKIKFAIALLAAVLMLAPALARASGETCGLELLNVPVGATIRVSVYWKSDDPDEAIEDEGYIFEVIDGGSGKLSVWRQPYLTYTMSPFAATGTRVAIAGYKDPASTTHNEGLETEGCVITATINSLPPWVKDDARISLPYLAIGGTGLMVLGNLHAGFKYAGGGALFLAAVAKKFADDPIDCSTAALATPVFATPPALPDDGTDPIVTLGNRIARNGTRTFAIAKAAETNANRAACPTFTAEERQALFTKAQNQAYRVGNHVARFERQVNNIVDLGVQAGITLDEVRDPNWLLEDAWFTMGGFGDGSTRNAPFIQYINDILLQVMTRAELDDLENAMLGIPLLDFHAGQRLYPDIWPDGAKFMFPALEQWSGSLIAKRSGQ